ncbi:MAG: hypothetical protein JL56_13110 [Desulfotomaculum sp. BICA1-6]|nr:MAG: hypothetical protein VR67_13140 [Peptococcaceae bacterium BRH_c8a]KJS72458.1 MAG: hypothetical protein JL56_13110 [Desulfotomaculum sp. BICA1-6]
MDFSKLFDLNGRVALITGGAGGIGQCVALGLAQQGCRVVVADKNISGLADLQQAVEAAGSAFMSLEVDVTDAATVDGMTESVVAALGGIDILVNCAGVNNRLSVVDLPEAEWDKIIDINLKGTFLCSKSVVKVMLQQQAGKIINIGSVSSVLGHPNHSAYAASKGGVYLLTKVLAMETARSGINVNCIGPAYIETPLTRDYLSKGDNYNKIAATIPMGRLGRPEDIVGAVVYLASPASDFVTGTLLLVDGGRCAD